MSNDDNGSDSGGVSARREELANIAVMVHVDFRRLVATLKRTLDLADDADRQLSDQLSSMIAAAERGLQLSRLLLDVTHQPRD